MLYLSLDKNHLKILYLKRSLLNQYDVHFFEKDHQVDLLDKGKIVNVDLVASAIKEALNFFSPQLKDNEVFLILPQESFSFFRAGVPADIAPSAIRAFIQDKARSQLEVDLEESSFEYFITDDQKQKQISFFALARDTLSSFQEVLNLLDLKAQMIMPETLTYFKLFEKTLRKEKKENIIYAWYTTNGVDGYLFDTFGLVSPDKWSRELGADVSIEQALKDQIAEFEKKGTKINRVILAGVASEGIRQDTFTKSVGVWTNPLKRIIPQFYEEYMKLLIAPSNKPFPLLSFDRCVGAFIFSQENKDFSFFKQGIKKLRRRAFSFPSIPLPRKEIFIFLVSFLTSLALFFAISKSKINFSELFPKNEPKKPVISVPVEIPTATPTPSLKRQDINIKVLNGSGTVGKATDVKNILKEKGYTEILTGNADTFDFTQSELQVKKSKAEAAILLKADLADNVSSFKESVLSEKEAADVIIIIGKDFK